VHDFGFCPLRLSEASGRLAYSRSSCRPASQLSSVQLVRSNRQILNKSKSRLERSIVRSCCLGSAQGRAIKTNTSVCHGQRGAHQEAANASSTCGTWGVARQKPGRVVVRHFCNWLLCPSVQTSPRHLSLQKALLWGTVMVRRRGKLQESLDAAELVTRPMRGAPCEGIGVTAAWQYRSCRGRSRILVEAGPHLAGAVFLSCGGADQGSLAGRGQILGKRAECA
jgi:hypothetical protein